MKEIYNQDPILSIAVIVCVIVWWSVAIGWIYKAKKDKSLDGVHTGLIIAFVGSVPLLNLVATGVIVLILVVAGFAITLEKSMIFLAKKIMGK